MKAIIVGMGEVGKYLATVLAEEKHDVTVVDASAAALARAEEATDVLALRGNGAATRTLKEAGVGSADLVAFVTDRDEVNLLGALTAKQLGAKRTVARVDDPAYFDAAASAPGFARGLLGVDLVVSVQALVAQEVVKLVESVGALAVEHFAGGRVEVTQLRVEPDADAAGRMLSDLSLPVGVIVAAVSRGEEVIVPGGGDAIRAGDSVFVVGAPERVRAVEGRFGKTRKRRARRVVIVGGGEVGLTVARQLEDGPVSVTLIDEDAERCSMLARQLRSTTILHGDGTDLALLTEERVGEADVVVAASGDDEINLMASLLAKQLGARKTVTLVHRPDYVPTYELLGLDAVVSPRTFAAGQLLRYVRRGEVVSVSLLEGGRAEVLEIVPEAGSGVVGTRLADLGLPRGAVVAAVACADGTVIVPDGRTVLQAGDPVVVVTLPTVRPDVERLFRKRLFGFGGR